ncbi:MAG: toll/interleukin-1 receptor domain-containing protein, partial [Actinobacteria bacterium]|nr:toll/interleukin-1 receptor domain-containing protein [Actinomycetota bacterium]
PGLCGRLDPVRHNSGEAERYELFADNISINDQPDQPYPFTLGQPLMLEDAQGDRAVVTIVSLIGRSSLVRFEK